ncbi:hypothetical protein ACVWZ4_007215 [Bradyrhizobium sp. USDA 4472]
MKRQNKVLFYVGLFLLWTLPAWVLAAFVFSLDDGSGPLRVWGCCR